MKVAELIGAPLDYWVARADGYSESNDSLMMHVDGTCRIAWHEGDDPDTLFNPSASWAWGGPIIERERIAVYWDVDEWVALWRSESSASGTLHARGPVMAGPTILAAAMRCYVASKFGNEVPAENS